MNAMEHGSHYHEDQAVTIEVFSSPDQIMTRITDHGGAPLHEPVTPDLEAKLAQEQTPRGWGLFLIKNLVDEMRVVGDGAHHTVELIVSREDDTHAHATI